MICTFGTRPSHGTTGVSWNEQSVKLSKEPLPSMWRSTSNWLLCIWHDHLNHDVLLCYTMFPSHDVIKRWIDLSAMFWTCLMFVKMLGWTVFFQARYWGRARPYEIGLLACNGQVKRVTAPQSYRTSSRILFEGCFDKRQRERQWENGNTYVTYVFHMTIYCTVY